MSNLEELAAARFFNTQVRVTVTEESGGGRSMSVDALMGPAKRARFAA